MPLTVILPHNEYSAALQKLILPLLPPDCRWRDPAEGLEGLREKKILFAIALDEGGCNVAYYRMLTILRRDNGLLDGCVGGVIVIAGVAIYGRATSEEE